MDAAKCDGASAFPSGCEALYGVAGGSGAAAETHQRSQQLTWTHRDNVASGLLQHTNSAGEAFFQLLGIYATDVHLIDGQPDSWQASCGTRVEGLYMPFCSQGPLQTFCAVYLATRDEPDLSLQFRFGSWGLWPASGLSLHDMCKAPSLAGLVAVGSTKAAHGLQVLAVTRQSTWAQELDADMIGSLDR